MSLSPQLRSRLVYSKVVTEEQMAAAEQFASRDSIPLDQALVTLQFAGYGQIGRSLSELSDMPYHPLLDSAIPPEVAGMVGPKWALRWGLCPLSYDPASQLLTVAVSTPDLVPRVHHLCNFFMEPYTLAFTIASEAEIRKLIEKHFGASVSPASEPSGGKPAALSGDSKQGRPPEPTKSRLARSGKAAAGADGKQRLPLFGKGSRPTVASKPQAAVDEVGRYLTSAAALLVAAYLGDDSATLNEIRVRVRYCQLLASRMNFAPDHISGVVIAAWLAALADRPQVVRQFLTPYNLDEILFPKEGNKEKLPPGARILNLVSCYEDMKKKDPASCREINLTRRSLHLLWSSSQADQTMLETFLQILMDEQFLANLNRAAGRILIVDHTEFSTSSMAPLLTNDGYDVCLVPTTGAAWDAIEERVPDLIICGMSQPQNSALDLCQKIKGHADTAHVPFLFLMTRDEEKRAAECLRVGADDFLVKPVDPELLFLKLHKLMKAPAADTTRTGVNGKLEDMNFTDMIQILSAGAKNMEVHLSSHGEEGRVFLKNGNVIHAAAGSLQGEEAFYQLMKWREGSFTTQPCTVFPETTIQASTTSLLMEGARLSDEAGETKE